MRILAAILVAGCTSHTAQIASSTNDVRASAAAARQHIQAADRELQKVEEAAAQVHQQIGFVSDDENPIYSTLKFLSVATVVLVAGAVVYKLKR